MADDSLSGFGDAPTDAFLSEHLRRRVAKLVRTPADEKHLFVIVHHTDLRFEVAYSLMFGTTVPSGPAWLPDGISHLWLTPQFSNRVLVGIASDWVQTHPYDK